MTFDFGAGLFTISTFKKGNTIYALFLIVSTQSNLSPIHGHERDATEYSSVK